MRINELIKWCEDKNVCLCSDLVILDDAGRGICDLLIGGVEGHGHDHHPRIILEKAILAAAPEKYPTEKSIPTKKTLDDQALEMDDEDEDDDDDDDDDEEDDDKDESDDCEGLQSPLPVKKTKPKPKKKSNMSRLTRAKLNKLCFGQHDRGVTCEVCCYEEECKDNPKT